LLRAYIYLLNAIDSTEWLIDQPPAVRVRLSVHELPDRKPCDSGIKATVVANFRKDPVLRRQTGKRNEEINLRFILLMRTFISNTYN